MRQCSGGGYYGTVAGVGGMVIRTETLKEAWRRQQCWRTPLPGVVLAPGGTCSVTGPSGAAKTDLLYLFAVAFCARANDRRLLWIDADARFHPLRILAVCRAVVGDAWRAVLARVGVRRARSASDAAQILTDADPNDVVVILDGSDAWIPLDSKQQFRSLKQALNAFCQRGGMVCVSARDPPPPQWYRLVLYPTMTIAMTQLSAADNLFQATVSQGPKSRRKFKLQADEDGVAVIPFDS